MGAGEPEVTLEDGSRDKFRCDVEMGVEASVIRLTNKRTGDVWTCEVTTKSVRDENAKQQNVLCLENHHRLVMTLLLDFLQGNLHDLRRLPYLSLRQDHSPYCMKLTLGCYLDNRHGVWSFDMIPQDPGAIQERELEEKKGKTT